MTYTVNKMAKLSGVSIRTLRYYDEIGLLKPAYVGDTGYRYYQEEQLLLLQQILFFRELGFELKQIQEILSRDDFDKSKALQSHRVVLEKNIRRLRELIKTVDTTIEHLRKNDTMNEKELFIGFDKEKQCDYEEYLVAKLGADRSEFAECKDNMKSWTQHDWDWISVETDAIHIGLVSAIKHGLKPNSDEVQKLIQKHFTVIQKFWTPSQESYTGLGQLYIEHADFKAMFDKLHPELADYLAQAMKIYADKYLA